MPGSLNQLQHSTKPIHQLCKQVDHAGIDAAFAVAQQRQQRLTRMRQPFEPGEAQEPDRPLDCVYGTKDLGKPRTVVRPALQVVEAALHAIETFAALDQKFLGEIVHILSIGTPRRRNKPRPADVA